MNDFSTYSFNDLTITVIQSLSEQTCTQLEEVYGEALPEEFSLLFNKNPRTQFKQIDEQTTLLIIRAVMFNAEEEIEQLFSIRVISHKNRIYLACEQALSVLEKTTLLSKNINTTFDFLLYLLENITEELEEHIYAIEEQIELMEEALLADFDMDIRVNILHLRRKVIELRKHLLPQREVINKLLRSTGTEQSSQNNDAFDLYQKTLRICDNLDAMRERLGLMQEEITTSINDRMNQNTYRLSIVATIFLPLGFITGLLGINVGGIPGAQNHDAFLFVVLGSFFIGICIWGYFKYKKWLP